MPPNSGCQLKSRPADGHDHGGALLLISDRQVFRLFDRRTVILVIQILATLAAVAGFVTETMNFYSLLVAAFIFGGLHTPLYSLFIAHANDFLTPRQIVGTASMLIMINGIGAIFGAPIVGYAMNIFGPAAFFPTLAVMHLIMTAIVVCGCLHGAPCRLKRRHLSPRSQPCNTYCHNPAS